MLILVLIIGITGFIYFYNKMIRVVFSTKDKSLFRLAELLKAKYREHATIERLFYPNHPLPIEQCYLHLALVEEETFNLQRYKQNVNSGSRNYFLHDYERILHSQRKLTPEQLLTECHRAPKRIYIEGAAGAGKTTLGQFIAYQWGSNHPAWKHYDFLFHIRLRDLTSSHYPNQNIDFIEMLEKECFQLGFSDSLINSEKENLSHYLKSKDKKVLFILDGYDELSLENHAMKMLWKNIVNSSYDFIITSRPGMLKTDLSTHLNVAVLGFSDEQVKKYLQYFFDPQHTPDASPQDAYQCLQTLRQNPNLWNLAHTPIQLELLCSLWEEDFKLTSDITLTHIYTSMVEQLLKRQEEKRLKKEEYDHVILKDIDIAPLIDRTKIYLEFLENAAFMGMENNKLIISSSMIEVAYDNITVKSKEKAAFFRVLRGLGLITHGSDRRQMEFIHLTFQEYFTARYIVRCFRWQQVPTPYATLAEFVQKKKYHRRYEIVWWFVAGLLKGETDLLTQYFNLLQSVSHDLTERYQFSLQLNCLAECELNVSNEYKNHLLSQAEIWIQQLCLISNTSSIEFSLPTIIMNQQQIISLLLDNIDAILDWGFRFKTRLRNLPDSILQSLVALLSHENVGIRVYAARVLYQQTILPETILQLLATLLSHDNENIRFDAAEALSYQICLPETILQLLATLLSHDNENIRLHAVASLYQQTLLPKTILQSLVKLLSDDDEEVRFNAAVVLSHQTRLPKTILQSLATLLSDDDEDIQANAVEALSHQTYLPETILQSLATLLSHNNENIRASAAWRLSKQTPLPEPILQSLVKLLSDDDEEVQFNAVEALSHQTCLPNTILQSLTTLLSYDNEDMRASAVKALSQQTRLPEPILQSLVKLLSDDDKEVRFNAVEALSHQTCLPDAILQSLETLLNDDNVSLKIRFSAARVLSHQTCLPETILQSLVTSLNHQNEVICTNAVEALSHQTCLPETIIKQLIQLDNHRVRYILSRQIQLPKSVLIHISQGNIDSFNILYCIKNILIHSLCNYLNRYQWEMSDSVLLKLILLKCLDQKVALYFYENTLYVGGEAQEGKFSSECQTKITQTLKQLFTEITSISAGNMIELEADFDLQIKEKSENNLDFSVSKELMMQEQTKKYDVFLNEIKETTEAIDMLISHIDLKTKIKQELQNISNELVKAKAHAGHTNERIRLAAQTTYDGCINRLNYFKTTMAQEKNYPSNELNQVISYLEDIITKISPKIELHSYSVTQMQEVQSQGLFFTQRYLSNVLNELSPLGKDFKELLETIKTTMGSNRYSCFISYAKPINETNGPDRFIQPFLETLRDHLLLAGFNPLLDFKCIEAGENLEAYMKQTLISNHWLLIGTPSLPQRINQQAPVAFEMHVETLRKVNKLNNVYPMIPVLVVGNVVQSLPWHKQSHNTIDLTQSSYLAGLKKLLQTLSQIPEQHYNNLWKAFEAKYPEHMQALSASLVKQILQNEQQKEQLRCTHIENKQANVYQGYSQPITNAEVKSKSYSRPVSGVHMWQEDKKSDTSNPEGIHYEYKYHPEYKRSDIEFEIEDGCDPRVFNFIENLYQKNKNSSFQLDSIENPNQKQFIEAVLEHKPVANTNRPISSELKVHEANFSIKVKSKKPFSPNVVNNNNL